MELKDMVNRLKAMAQQIMDMADELGECGYYDSAADVERSGLDLMALAGRLDEEDK